MYSLKVGEIVVIKVYTETEEEASIAPIHNLEVSKLREKGGGGAEYTRGVASKLGKLLQQSLCV